MLQAPDSAREALYALFSAPEPHRGSGRGDETAALLEAVASSGDGIALLDDILADGHDPEIVAACLVPGADKRKRPTLAATTIGPWRVLSLTSSGFAAAGMQGRRPSSPSAATLRHRLSPRHARTALLDRVAPVARERGVMLDVISGAALRSYCEDRRGEAWSMIKAGGSTQDQADASVVLSGVVPDMLVLESWHEDALRHRPQVWPSTSDPVALVDPQPCELLISVEIELAAKFSPEVLGLKIRRSTVAQRLGWFSATVWVADDLDVVERLRRAGCFATPGHYLINACALGIDAEHVSLPPEARAPWWLGSLASQA